MPVEESDLEFDAYNCDPERWLEFGPSGPNPVGTGWAKTGHNLIRGGEYPT